MTKGLWLELQESDSHFSHMPSLGKFTDFLGAQFLPLEWNNETYILRV